MKPQMKIIIVISICSLLFSIYVHLKSEARRDNALRNLGEV